MLDDKQLELVQSKLAGLSGRVRLELGVGPNPDDPFVHALREVTAELVGAAPEHLELSERPGQGPYPSLRVKNIEYFAVPLDRELEPFLDLLGFLTNGSGLEPLAGPPARVEVLIAPTCPNCPAVVRACAQVAAAWSALTMVVIDVQYFTELAGSCRSVPTVVIDGAHTVVGPVSSRDLIEILERRGEPGYLARALGSMVESGRLAEVAPLLTGDEGFAAMATLMRDGTMQQKMGLMLAVEQILEGSPHAIDGAVPHLLPLLESEVATLRGDVADLLGQIGAPGAREALSLLLDDENADVREVAEEAIQRLRDPS